MRDGAHPLRLARDPPSSPGCLWALTPDSTPTLPVHVDDCDCDGDGDGDCDGDGEGDSDGDCDGDSDCDDDSDGDGDERAALLQTPARKPA